MNAEAGGDHVEHRPERAVNENRREAEWPHVAIGSRPSQLMMPEAGEIVILAAHRHDGAGELDIVAGLGNFGADVKIVREEILHRAKTADRIQRLTLDGDGGAE